MKAIKQLLKKLKRYLKVTINNQYLNESQGKRATKRSIIGFFELKKHLKSNTIYKPLKLKSWKNVKD